MQQPSYAIGHGDSDVDLRQLLAICVGGRWILISTIMVFVLFWAAYIFISTPIYRADAVIQVEKKASSFSAVSDLSSLLEVGEGSAVTEINIIQTRHVLGTAVDRLDLTLIIGPGGGMIARKLSKYKIGDLLVSDFNAPADVYGKNFELEKGVNGQFDVSLNGQKIGSGFINKPVILNLENGRVSFTVNKMNGEQGTLYSISKITRRAAIDQLSGVLEIEETRKQSGIIKLTLTGPDKASLVKIIDAVTTAYVQQNIDRRAEEAQKGLSFLQDQLPKVKNDLNRSEEALNEYRVKNGSLDLGLEAKAVLDKTSELQTKLADLSIRETEIDQLYTKESPTYRALLEQRAIIEQQLADATKKISELPQTQLKIMELTRDVNVNEQIYLQIFSKVQELEVLRAGTVGNVRILDNADPEISPLRPRKGLSLMIALFTGLVSGIIILLGRQFLGTGIASIDELEDAGMSVIAVIPFSVVQLKFDRQDSIKSSSRLKGKSLSRGANLLAISHMEDAAVEGIRSLRTSLIMSLLSVRNNIIVITSPSPNAGKSFVSVNLAIVFASAGKRTILIDGDIRRGTLHKRFQLAQTGGLSAYLKGEVQLSSLIMPTGIPGVDVIGRGLTTTSSAELLMRAAMKDLIEWASANYDVVLIDTPPIQAVTDAAILCRYAGTTIMIARHSINSLREVQSATRRLNKFDISVSGYVLNGWKSQPGYQYTKYGYYSYDYKSEKNDDSK